MFNQYTYRPIVDEDISFLRKVYSESRAEELAMLKSWTEEQKLMFINQQFDAQHAHYRKHYSEAEFLIIEIEKDKIGRLYLEEMKDEFRIIDIALLSKWRGKGIGKAILQEIVEKATIKKKSVSIHVEKNNPALGLYKFLGFEEKEDKGVYWFMEKKCAEKVYENR